MAFAINDGDQARVNALFRHMLRHPGTVSTRAAKAVRTIKGPDGTITPEQLAEIKLECLKLGLGSEKS